MKKVLFLVLTIAFFTSVAFAANDAPSRKVVTTAGTAVALQATSQSYSQCDICAETDNTGVITVGYETAPVAALATRTGVTLQAGDCYSIRTSSANMKDLLYTYIDSTVNGDGVTFNYSV